MKHCATIDEQITTLKSHGVHFDLMKESDARNFLLRNSYYFKIKVYENNYDKIPSPDGYCYENLDFAYLVELSKIDYYLSDLVRLLCSNIEHALKIRFNRDLMACGDDEFITETVQSAFPRGLQFHDNPYTNSLQESCHGDYAPWQLWELLPLDDQLWLMETFYAKKGQAFEDKHMLFIVRKMRNAVSHGNCLLGDVTRPTPTKNNERYQSGDVQVTREALTLCDAKYKSGTAKSSLQQFLDYLVVNNYAAVLVCHLRYADSPRLLGHVIEDMRNFKKRILLRKNEYFGSKGRRVPRNKKIDMVLDALITLSDGYVRQAKEKIKQLRTEE